MPSKRDVLAHLTLDELLAAADRFGLPVADRRAREGLEGAVASSKKATLAEILPGYSRDRLKELCRALGLDDQHRVPLPPRAEQDAMVSLFESIAECDVQNREALEGLKGTKSALMSVLLTGELRVTPDQEPSQ